MLDSLLNPPIIILDFSIDCLKPSLCILAHFFTFICSGKLPKLFIYITLHFLDIIINQFLNFINELLCPTFVVKFVFQCFKIFLLHKISGLCLKVFEASDTNCFFISPLKNLEVYNGNFKLQLFGKSINLTLQFSHCAISFADFFLN